MVDENAICIIVMSEQNSKKLRKNRKNETQKN